jgi:formylglycine-generating enzyme
LVTKTRIRFGNPDFRLRDYGWFDQNASKAGEEYAHAVGLKKPNPWGLFDMHGNVREWCRDRYARYLGLGAGGVDPEVKTGDDGRIVRGGSWNSISLVCRSDSRIAFRPSIRSNDCGFRLALSLALTPPKKAQAEHGRIID